MVPVELAVILVAFSVIGVELANVLVWLAFCDCVKECVELAVILVALPMIGLELAKVLVWLAFCDCVEECVWYNVVDDLEFSKHWKWYTLYWKASAEMKENQLCFCIVK